MIEKLSLLMLAVGIVNGAIVVSLIVLWHRQSAAMRILGLFILLLIVRSALYVVGREGIFDPHSWLYVPPLEISMVYGPCMYLFVVSLTEKNWRRIQLLHLAPVLLQAIYYLALLLLPVQLSRSLLATIHLPWTLLVEPIIVAVSLLWYCALSWKKLSTYKAWVQDRLSDAENYNLRYLSLFVVASSAFAVVWIATSIQSWWLMPNYQTNYLLFLSQSALVCLLSFEAWKHAGSAFPQIDISDTTARKNRSQHSSSDAERWLTYLQTNQWWKDQDLTLASLAQKLGTNTSTLSATINNEWGENFNTTVNRLRVAYLCEQLKQDNDLTLLELAFDAGFNSKNSFNRNFKRFTGVSPSQFKQNQGTKS